MRKMFLLFGMLVMVGVLFVACSEQQDLTSPEEAAFGKNKVTYECETYDLQEELNALNAAAETIFDERQSTLKGVVSNIDNLARKVCTGDPNTQAALEQYYELETLVNGQDPSKLNTSMMSAAEFLAMARSFATGGLYVIESPDDIPELGLELVAESFEGALRIFQGTFRAEDFPVTFVEYRLPDDYTGGDGYSFGDYTPFLLPEIWWFDASAQPVGEFEAWVCLVDDSNYEQVVMAHAKDDGTVELLPKLPEDKSPLDCTNAAVQTALSQSSPGWLQLAARALKPVVSSILGVKPLNAMYFAGKGLGGRGTSFSPHAGVQAAPTPAITYDRSELNTGDYNYYHFNTTNWEDFPAELFVELTEGVECPSRTVVEIYDAFDNSLIQTQDCLGSVDTFWFEWPLGINPPDNIYIVLWDQLLDVRYRSNTTAITIVTNTLTVAGAGTGSGTVTRPNSTGFDINCQITAGAPTGDCTHTVEEWVRYGTLTATADEGSTFTEWSDDCTGTTNTCFVNMDSDKTATARFNADVVAGYNLNLTVGANGQVTDDLEDNTQPCGTDGAGESCDWFWPNKLGASYLTVTASPDDGFAPLWTGCFHYSAYGPVCTLEWAASMAASVTFVPNPSLTVTVTALNTADLGSPTVTDNSGNGPCGLGETCDWYYPDMEGNTIVVTVTPGDGCFPTMNIDIGSAPPYECSNSGSGSTPVACSFEARGAKVASVGISGSC